MIFSWLAATYLRAVPMGTYPSTPAANVAPVLKSASMAAATLEEDLPVRLIVTGTGQ